ncbi:MAG: aspartate/glutamate racemase family protein [Pseudomonadota bacterium]
MLQDECEIIEHLPFTTVADTGARVGLVVLASDYTVEDEFRRLAAPFDVSVFMARIRNSPNITPDSLAAMGPLLTDTVDLILPSDRLDVVAFACTSASVVLGSERVAQSIGKARPTAVAANPMDAAFAAFRAYGAKRIAVLTPYRRDVNIAVRVRIEEAGYSVPVFGSFNEERDPVVAAIDLSSLRAGIRTLIDRHAVDAVFVSCTSIRMADAIADLEAEFSLPVTSSNHALAWHCIRLAGRTEAIDGQGRLFELPIVQVA